MNHETPSEQELLMIAMIRNGLRRGYSPEAIAKNLAHTSGANYQVLLELVRSIRDASPK